MFILAFAINFFLYLSVSGWANAIYDPKTVPNNKIGIHILFPEEIGRAAQLVNNDQKGAWGYVTIPIQASDRDRDKWQQFFDKCVEHKIIPIIRVATVPEGSNWTEPNNYDLIDFANFLGDLRWPTANRYVIIFNEVNRSDEYGGYVKPETYADILSNAYDIFKNISSDFFILPAGLDNAAPNNNGYMNHRRYIERMYLHRQDIFDHIDGWTSHAYPNPDFSARPDISGNNKIDSFKYDLQLIHKFTTKDLPIFITETGWSTKHLSDTQVAYYYQHALKKVWNNSQIIAITPFLLNAQSGPFAVFSFTNNNGQFRSQAIAFSAFSSIGEPLFPALETNKMQIDSSQNSASPSSQEDAGTTAPQLFNRLFFIFTSLFGFKKIE